MKKLVIAIILLISAFMVFSCSSSELPTDPALIVMSFFEALDAGDLEGAMVFVADDAEFVFPELYIGKDQIRDHFRKDLEDRNASYELSDISVEGETVRFTALTITSVARVEQNVEAVLENGKIVFLLGD